MKNNIVEKSIKSFIRRDNFWNNKKMKAEKTIQKLQADIEIQNKIISDYYHKSPNWTEIIMPIINDIEKHTGLIHDSHEKLVPHGLKARVSVFFYKKTKNGKHGKLVSSLVFVPYTQLGHNELQKPLITLETGKTKTDFQKNTIGDINGLNIEEIEMPNSITEIIKFMKKYRGLK